MKWVGESAEPMAVEWVAMMGMLAALMAEKTACWKAVLGAASMVEHWDGAMVSDLVLLWVAELVEMSAVEWGGGQDAE